MEDTTVFETLVMYRSLQILSFTTMIYINFYKVVVNIKK